MTVRRATVDDVDRLVHLRVAFLREEGHDIDEPSLREAVSTYLERALPAEDVRIWVVEDGGTIVANGAMTVYERMSWDGVSNEGYVLNMYTVPHRRNEGIASAIVDAMLEHARANDIKLALIALDDGRAIYERVGFTSEPRYMRWRR